MSKCIKQNDIFELVRTGRLVGNNNFENVSKAVGILPTIEVSEDCISRRSLYKELDKVTAVTPTQIDMLSDFTNIIKEVPSVVPQVPSEDCISKEYLKSFEYINKGDFNSVETIREWIDNAPSVVPTVRKNRQVERAEGEWIRTFDGNEWFWYCSNCKDQWYEDDLWMGGNEFPHFCPNCGAKMKG